jgi:hemophore-related protein
VLSSTTLRRQAFGVVASCAFGGLVVTGIPAASAEPACTAATLSTTLGGVASATGQYLDTHPDANQAVTNAGSMSPQDGENAIRTYFVNHPGEWAELRNFATPLANLRHQCQVQVAPAQIARLYDAMSQ